MVYFLQFREPKSIYVFLSRDSVQESERGLQVLSSRLAALEEKALEFRDRMLEPLAAVPPDVTFCNVHVCKKSLYFTNGVANLFSNILSNVLKISCRLYLRSDQEVTILFLRI